MGTFAVQLRQTLGKLVLAREDHAVVMEAPIWSGPECRPPGSRQRLSMQPVDVAVARPQMTRQDLLLAPNGDGVCLVAGTPKSTRICLDGSNSRPAPSSKIVSKSVSAPRTISAHRCGLKYGFAAVPHHVGFSAAVTHGRPITAWRPHTAPALCLNDSRHTKGFWYMGNLHEHRVYDVQLL
jgi:hypothetical protein